jgi:hypothetical protein
LLVTHRQVELRFGLVFFGFCHWHLNRASDLKRPGTRSPIKVFYTPFFIADHAG